MNKMKNLILSFLDKIMYLQDHDDIDIVTETSQRLSFRFNHRAVDCMSTEGSN